MLGVEIVSRNKLLVGVCYRPPDSFWEDTSIQHPVDIVGQAGKNNTVITGDMNSDFNMRDGQHLVNANNMSALINEPTRITPKSATILDQFLASDHLSVTDISVVAPLESSNHCDITCKLKSQKNTNEAST